MNISKSAVPKSKSIESLETQAKLNKVSVKLDKLKFSSPSDIKSYKSHFSASEREKNPRAPLKRTVSDSNKTLKLNSHKKPSPKKSFTSTTDKNECPVKGCDSTGHLSGFSSRHSTYDTCPIFFQINNTDKITDTKKPVEATKRYKEKMTEALKEVVYKKDEPKATNSTFLNQKIFGNIQNLSTSFLISSITNDLTASSIVNANTSKELNKIEPPFLNDLKVSQFELDLFKEGVVESAKMKEIITETGEIINPTSYLKLSKKEHKIIKFGDYEIESWYKSPYPEEIWRLDQIFICQFCLKYMKSNWILNRHLEKCIWKHPPGREIYRKDTYSLFEVDGKINKIYCQNLCLLAKLFIDHKTLYFDVEPFLFYILTSFNSSNGTYEMIGYFSKEKFTPNNYNLSCILIMPTHMNKGFGKMLIGFSYLLSRAEGKIGSPETPLSDLGLISYRNYWITTLLNKLAEHSDNPKISIKDLSNETGIAMNDIISTFQFLGLIKYFKGNYVIKKNQELLDKYAKKKRSAILDIDPERLKWNSNQTNSPI